MGPEPEPVLWVVAGCLFEVSLPVATGTRWRWANPEPTVTLLGEEPRRGRHHLRFRGEAAGALAGRVELRFHDDGNGAADRVIAVRIAPERLPAD